jgi:hypothetical protein
VLPQRSRRQGYDYSNAVPAEGGVRLAPVATIAAQPPSTRKDRRRNTACSRKILRASRLLKDSSTCHQTLLSLLNVPLPVRVPVPERTCVQAEFSSTNSARRDSKRSPAGRCVGSGKGMGTRTGTFAGCFSTAC